MLSGFKEMFPGCKRDRMSFIVLIASVIVRGIDIRCGCFGDATSDAEAIGWSTLLRDIALLVPIVLAGLPSLGTARDTSETNLPDAAL